MTVAPTLSLIKSTMSLSPPHVMAVTRLALVCAKIDSQLSAKGKRLHGPVVCNCAQSWMWQRLGIMLSEWAPFNLPHNRAAPQPLSTAGTDIYSRGWLMAVPLPLLSAMSTTQFVRPAKGDFR